MTAINAEDRPGIRGLRVNTGIAWPSTCRRWLGLLVADWRLSKTSLILRVLAALALCLLADLAVVVWDGLLSSGF